MQGKTLLCYITLHTFYLIDNFFIYYLVEVLLLQRSQVFQKSFSNMLVIQLRKIQVSISVSFLAVPKKRINNNCQ